MCVVRCLVGINLNKFWFHFIFTLVHLLLFLYEQYLFEMKKKIEQNGKQTAAPIFAHQTQFYYTNLSHWNEFIKQKKVGALRIMLYETILFQRNYDFPFFLLFLLFFRRYAYVWWCQSLGTVKNEWLRNQNIVCDICWSVKEKICLEAAASQKFSSIFSQNETKNKAQLAHRHRQIDTSIIIKTHMRKIDRIHAQRKYAHKHQHIFAHRRNRVWAPREKQNWEKNI